MSFGFDRSIFARAVYSEINAGRSTAWQMMSKDIPLAIQLADHAGHLPGNVIALGLATGCKSLFDLCNRPASTPTEKRITLDLLDVRGHLDRDDNVLRSALDSNIGYAHRRVDEAPRGPYRPRRVPQLQQVFVARTRCSRTSARRCELTARRRRPRPPLELLAEQRLQDHTTTYLVIFSDGILPLLGELRTSLSSSASSSELGRSTSPSTSSNVLECS